MNISIFTTCRAFDGKHAFIQRNALTSWTLLYPRPEIIVFGNDTGVAETCRELDLRYESELKATENGIPFVDDLFLKAQLLASHDLLCYVNADIVVTQELITAAEAVAGRFSQFLMTGLRWDLDIGEPIDFSDNWSCLLRMQAERRGNFHHSTGADYFFFPRGLYQNIPDFIIGRSAWDNWLIMSVARRSIPLIDATRAVFVVHHGLTSPACDEDFEHNQALWFAADPSRGEGSIRSATWEIDETCQIFSRP